MPLLKRYHRARALRRHLAHAQPSREPGRRAVHVPPLRLHRDRRGRRRRDEGRATTADRPAAARRRPTTAVARAAAPAAARCRVAGPPRRPRASASSSARRLRWCCSLAPVAIDVIRHAMGPLATVGVEEARGLGRIAAAAVRSAGEPSTAQDIPAADGAWRETARTDSLDKGHPAHAAHVPGASARLAQSALPKAALFVRRAQRSGRAATQAAGRRSRAAGRPRIGFRDRSARRRARDGRSHTDQPAAVGARTAVRVGTAPVRERGARARAGRAAIARGTVGVAAAGRARRGGSAAAAARSAEDPPQHHHGHAPAGARSVHGGPG
jgi:hypothetical protein